MDYLITIILLTLSGIFSGLTIGLLGLSKSELEMQAELGCKDSKRVLTIVSNQNLLLVALLLGNTAVNSSLSVFLGGVVGSGFIAVVTATIFILIFGEILPAALLSKSENAIKFGSKVTPAISLLIKVLYYLIKPIASILDKLVGTDLPRIFNRREFAYVFRVHKNSQDSDFDNQDEKFLTGVLSLHEKNAKEHMTHISNVFFIEHDKIIDGQLLDEIRLKGFTRIPVIKDKTIIGVINSKTLVGLDDELEDKKTALEIMRADKFLTVQHTEKLDDLFNLMVKKRIHFATVLEDNNNIGIITKEDIEEEMIQEEIYDETDNV